MSDETKPVPHLPRCAFGQCLYREVDVDGATEPLLMMVASGGKYPLGAVIVEHGAKPGDVLIMAANRNPVPYWLGDGQPGLRLAQLQHIVAWMPMKEWLANRDAGAYANLETINEWRSINGLPLVDHDGDELPEPTGEPN